VGFVTVKVALPAVRVSDVGAPLSTASETLPVGVPPVELTVTVTEPFAPAAIAGADTVVDVAAGFTVNDPEPLLAVKPGCAA
jgi:hypothetical protein